MLFNFKFKPFTVVLLLLATCTFAQTGIGTSTPHASAKLHVSATDKGFLPPRVTLTTATDVTTIPNPAEGLLVYNLGSVGLQAGYYYWNNANWATIATGTTAGNAVVAGDMVKLYSEVYSAAVGKIAHANGYSFTVPVSGRYLFDFSSTGYINQASFTFTFSVRQGTTVLASDFQTSANNNVHVEYNGKLEVNLQSGITYNVYVNSTGSRDSGDSDRVYYKMVAGNLPVNQHVADRNIQLNNNYLSNDGGNEGIRIDNSGRVGIGTASPNASAILDLSSTTQGVLIPRMTASQRAAIANPVAGLVVYQTNANPGNYVYNGSTWDVLSNANYGDVKTGIQTADHNGWVLLNGRAKSSLSATQQDQATTLGIGTTLPNAADAFLVQNGTALGSVSGSNSKTLTQANLPNVSFQGSTNTTGLHDHTGSVNGVYTPSGTNSGGTFPAGSGYYFKVGNLNINESGNHSHTVSVSSGGSGAALDITPRSLSVNTFIYLGL